MHLHLESADKFAVQAYSDSEVKIDGEIYQHNLIASAQGVLTDWPVTRISEMIIQSLNSFLAVQPEIIIIGHTESGKLPSPAIFELLSQKRIGLESMSIGAACRTYNVLLSEQRRVALGIILNPGLS
ncbi:Mth938-like domain-containing protein [Legionella sp. 16cNR16C]|uniref:Mth938-like domain-containing protein n=1 Tax=Legionella sp. 16cNR16C TaxID=2905656 RepID=UPI001E60BC39|nr:MTH938/NDUFAF3 family protein [Legionella sp. 16cNR16C]MCE3043883.1 MTH938/NDUFAF3 family protein [Legionella sp. 16cNR16C]